MQCTICLLVSYEYSHGRIERGRVARVPHRYRLMCSKLPIQVEKSRDPENFQFHRHLQM